MLCLRLALIAAVMAVSRATPGVVALDPLTFDKFVALHADVLFKVLSHVKTANHRVVSISVYPSV
jgi:hypothetical protein